MVKSPSWGPKYKFVELLMFGSLRRIAVVAFFLLPAVVPSLRAAENSPMVRAMGAESAFVVEPGESRDLTVRVSEPGGTPVTDATVLFVGPGEGSGGSFPQTAETLPTFIRVQTDSNGVASATFVANSNPGVFLVEAKVEGTDGSASFAFTIVSKPVKTAATASEMQAAVREQIVAGATSGATVRLHGPVLVPAGAEISSGRFPVPYPESSPIVTKKPSWVLWIDDEPLAKFEHAVRWVLIDADTPAAGAGDNATVLHRNWWPVVTIPGAPQDYSLLPPGGSTPESFAPAGDIPPLDELGTTPVRTTPYRAAIAAKDACAVVIYGPDLGHAGYKDAIDYRKHLIEAGLVPANRILMNVRRSKKDGKNYVYPVNNDDLARIFGKAKTLGCKKLYFFFSTHGFQAGLGGGVVIDDDARKPNKTAGITFATLTSYLEDLGKIKLCIVLDSCFSGQFVRFIQGHGFTGTIITSADDKYISFTHNGRSVLTKKLLEVLRDPAKTADTNKDGAVDLREAFAFMRKNKKDKDKTGYDLLNGPNPQSSPISPTGTREMVTFDLYIPNQSSTGNLLI